MSARLFEIVSLAARYLFTLLGVLIVLRAYAWLLADRAEKHRRLRSLPDAGMVGELVVLSGADLPEGTGIPVPWEGVLGSVRSCDVFIPASGVKRRHLSFSFVPGQGLLVTPFSGCGAAVNEIQLTCRSRACDAPLVHGSFLRVGSALLRLRIFAGLDPSAGFDDEKSTVPEQAGPLPDVAQVPEDVPFPGYMQDQAPICPEQTAYPPEVPYAAYPHHLQEQPAFPAPLPPAEGPSSFEAPPGAEPVKPARRRRCDRWEADWSE